MGWKPLLLVSVVLALIGAGVFLAIRTTSPVVAVGDLMEDRGWEGNSDMPPGPDLDGDGKPNDMHWDRADLPLTVVLSPSLPAAYGYLVQNTITETNQLMGRRVFSDPVLSTDSMATLVEVVGGKPPRRYIYVQSDEGAAPRLGRTTLYSLPDGRLYSVVVQLPLTQAGTARGVVLVYHELAGHGLGLAHNTDPASVMHPKIQNHPQHFLVGESTLLRKIYAKESCPCFPKP